MLSGCKMKSEAKKKLTGLEGFLIIFAGLVFLLILTQIMKDPYSPQAGLREAEEIMKIDEMIRQEKFKRQYNIK